MKKSTLTLLTASLLTNMVSAQIIHTDLDPDLLIENSTQSMDLNGDGTNDVSIDNWSDYVQGSAYAEFQFLNNFSDLVIFFLSIFIKYSFHSINFKFF